MIKTIIIFSILFMLLWSLKNKLQHIKNKLKIIPVSSIDEVVSNALVKAPQGLSILDASKITKNDSNNPDKTSISH